MSARTGHKKPTSSTREANSRADANAGGSITRQSTLGPVPTVYDLTREELAERLTSWGEPAFRTRQVWSQVWRRAATYDRMSDIAPALRERLAAELPMGVEVLAERTADRGSTRKGLLRVGDAGHLIETVLMGYRDRVTVCVSSQSGCAMGCTFCATGQMGLRTTSPRARSWRRWPGRGGRQDGCRTPARSASTSCSWVWASRKVGVYYPAKLEAAVGARYAAFSTEKGGLELQGAIPQARAAPVTAVNNVPRKHTRHEAGSLASRSANDDRTG